MKIRTLSLTLAIATLPVLASAQQAAAPAAAADQPAKPVPQTAEAWLNRMTDFTQNMSAYKDPKVFVPWFNAVTEPGFYTTMGNLVMDPAGWLRMMNSMVDPGAYRNVAEFADPNVYMRWLAASMDPNFYNALVAVMTDPGKMMRWAMLPVDPKLWGMMLSTLNPGMYMKWMMAPLDPRAMQLAIAPFNPNVYLGWLGAAMDPKTYGPMWAGFLNPTLPAVTTPWTTAPYGTSGFNPFDPNALMGMFGLPAPAPMPAAPAAAPAPAAPAPAAAAPATPAPAAVTPTAAPVAKTMEAAKPVEATTPAVAAKPAEPPKAEAAKPAEAAKASARMAPTSKVVLAGDALFKLNKSGVRDLSQEGKQRLDEVADRIKALGEVEQIKIVGHADATGKAEANRKLSEARARSVKAYLVAKGVKPSVIITSGMGDTQPVVQCDMQQPRDKLAECLAPNRRVEIEVIGKAK